MREKLKRLGDGFGPEQIQPVKQTQLAKQTQPVKPALPMKLVKEGGFVCCKTDLSKVKTAGGGERSKNGSGERTSHEIFSRALRGKVRKVVG